MSIVKISENLHEAVRRHAKALNRSINMQVEHWIRLGQYLEAHPDHTYRDAWAHFLKNADAELPDEQAKTY